MARDAHPYLSPDEKSSVKNPTIVLYLEETLFRHISSSGLEGYMVTVYKFIGSWLV